MSKGLKNPVAVAAATTGTEMAVKGAPKAAKKANKDTGGAFSWVLLGVVVVGAFYAFKVLKNVGKVTDAAGNVIDSVGGAVAPTPGAGGGNVGDINPIGQVSGATINSTQAQTIATGLLNNFRTLGKANEREKQNIYALLHGKNAWDYQLISNAFGTPRRNPITGEVAPILLGERLNLTQWLTVEIGAEGINHLRTITHGIF